MIDIDLQALRELNQLIFAGASDEAIAAEFSPSLIESAAADGGLIKVIDHAIELQEQVEELADFTSIINDSFVVGPRMIEIILEDAEEARENGDDKPDNYWTVIDVLQEAVKGRAEVLAAQSDSDE